MSKRVFIPGLSVFLAFAMVGSISATALAQQIPVRVIQGTDGTMYVVQGDNSWTLVPDQASDSDVAALNPGGEIDGTLPNELFVVQAPAAPPPAAEPAPPAAPAPPPPAAPAPPPAAAPSTAIDFTGRAGVDVAHASPIKVGDSITSVVDRATRAHDVYSLAFTAGATYQILFTGVETSSPNYVDVSLLNPNGTPAKSCPFLTSTGDVFGPPCTLTPAASNTYYISIAARSSGQKYIFTVRQL